jgi:hypothetical protein
MAVGDTETVKHETGADMKPVKLWIEEIAQAKKAHKDWWDACDRICKRYKAEAAEEEASQTTRRGGRRRRYNVLWSIVQTMMPLVYGTKPTPYVARRFLDKDPVGRDSSLVLQRALSYSTEDDVLHDATEDATLDFILTGRGVLWPKYTPYMQLRDSLDKTLAEGQYEEKVYEECDWEHVHYRDFLYGSAAKWKHVPWVGRHVPMTRKQLIKRFGEIGKKIPLTINAKQGNESEAKTDPKSDKELSDDAKGLFARAEVWEIWNKEDRRVYWVCPQFEAGFLDEKDDLLQLDRFFPCPKPAFGTKTNDSLIPTPDFMAWKDIAVELDEITQRIKLLTQALRVAGIYDATMGDTMSRLTRNTYENELIPVKGFGLMNEKGGLQKAIEFMPVDQVRAILSDLRAARRELVQELYEITGISDIIRGASDPRETAAAQRVKGNYAGKRIGMRTDEITRMVSEAFEIEAEIICLHYSPQTIQMVSSAAQVLVDPITGEPSPQRLMNALALLKNRGLRQYRVNVDDQSLSAADAEANRQTTVEFLGGMTQLLGAMIPAAKENPAILPLAGDMLLAGVRAYPMARSMEATIEASIEQIKNAPPPPPEAQAVATGKTPQEMQHEVALEQMKAQLERERMAQQQREADMQHQISLLDLQLKESIARAQVQNRTQESMLRKEKQDVDAQIRAEQVIGQNEIGRAGVELSAGKAMAEDERNRTKIAADTEVSMTKIIADYRKAFETKREAANVN